MTLYWLHFAIILFFVAGILLAGTPFILSMLVAPRAKTPVLRMPYECGVPTHGSAWTRFGINYYFYALLFLSFDVDVLFLFPVAVAYAEGEGLVPFIKVLLFVVILLASVLFFWNKGVFSWPRKITFTD